ncbi:MAG: pyrroloquinoline-quinone synthase PqqC [Deltaproteobacteria bacterium]|nr:pyrroloquinoline-quinone synthase PqqC [Deltaproteobacteria bacterium]
MKIRAVDLSMVPLEVPPSRRAFVQRLLDVGAARYHDRHPFHLRMNEGLLSRSELAVWAINRYYYQQNIPRKDAAILSNMPSPEVRRRWRKRIMDQDGESAQDSGLEAWLRLVEAVGGTREDAQDASKILPGVRFAVDAYFTFCRDNPWQDAVASSLTELFAPHLHALRVEAFPKHYPWVDAQGLDYFKRRVRQAKSDVEHGLSIVLDHFDTPEREDRAVACLTFKCELLWALLDAIDHHCAQHAGGAAA